MASRTAVKRRFDPPTLAPGRWRDPQYHGLQLHVSANGTLRRWCMRVRPKSTKSGKYQPPRWITIGYYPKLTLEGARTAAMIEHGVIRQTGQVRKPADAHTNPEQPRTVGEAIDRYLDSPMAVRKRETSESYRAGMKRALTLPKSGKDHLSTIRHLACGELRPSHIERLKDSAPVELLRKFKVCLRWCAKRGYLETSPAAGVELSQPGKDNRALIRTGERGIDWTELQKALRGIAAYEKKRPGSAWPAIYRLGLLTAVRPEEMLRLRWEDGEFDGDYPTLRIEGKTGERMLPLSKAAVRLLERHQPDEAKRRGWVFPSAEGKHITDQSKEHARIVELSKTRQPWSRKHLRKTVRTWFGWHQQDALGRLALGHSLQGMDAHYNSADLTGALRKMMNEWAAEVAKLDSPPPRPALKIVA